MKKLFIAAVAAVFAVMLVAPVYAADNLELGGNFRVRAWSTDNNSYVDDSNTEKFDQRLRLQGKINVADDAYALVRADLGDGAWGDDYGIIGPAGGQARPSEGIEFDFDYAYMHIEKEMWALTAGQQYVGLGHTTEAVDAISNGFTFRLNLGQVSPSFIYAKVDEGGSTDDDIGDDTDLYAFNLSFQVAEFDSNAFYAQMNDDSATEFEPWVAGISTSGTVGMVNLTSEINTFGGDNAAGTDFVGTQFYLGGSVDANDMVTIGGELLYALGNDDTGEIQATHLTDWGSFTPSQDNTPGVADWSYMPYGESPYDIASIEQGGGDGGGVQGITLYADATPVEKLSVGTKVGYFGAEEDDATYVDDVFTFNVYAAYEIATNTVVSLTYWQASPDYDSDAPVGLDEEDESIVYGKIQLSF